eukprot:GHVU01154825.1.p5 GENE.GHVU01154825.1~~GHVU01154825.1.p5  ORF type:complete len:115 (+),score=3.72 GHVU01154825.1:414-758(+)
MQVPVVGLPQSKGVKGRDATVHLWAPCPVLPVAAAGALKTDSPSSRPPGISTSQWLRECAPSKADPWKYWANVRGAHTHTRTLACSTPIHMRTQTHTHEGTTPTDIRTHTHTHL